MRLLQGATCQELPSRKRSPQRPAVPGVHRMCDHHLQQQNSKCPPELCHHRRAHGRTDTSGGGSKGQWGHQSTASMTEVRQMPAHVHTSGEHSRKDRCGSSTTFLYLTPGVHRHHQSSCTATYLSVAGVGPILLKPRDNVPEGKRTVRVSGRAGAAWRQGHSAGRLPPGGAGKGLHSTSLFASSEETGEYFWLHGLQSMFRVFTLVMHKHG